MAFNMEKKVPESPPVGGHPVRDARRRKLLAVCEHFTTAPLVTLDCLDLTGSADKPFYMDRFFARYETARPFDSCFNDETFDLVLCADSYQKYDCLPALADEIYRLLKSGGFCYLSGRGFFTPGRRDKTPGDKFYHTRRYLKKVFSDFWIHDYTPLIEENPGLFYDGYTPVERSGNIFSGFLGWLNMSFFSEFVWILTKKK